MWEQRGQELEVAHYVRTAIVAEGRMANASDRRLVLTYMDDLGISAGGLAKNRWIIGEAPAATRAARSTKAGPSARERLKVMDGGA